MEQTGKIEQILQDAQDYRLHCYRRMQLADMAEEEQYDEKEREDQEKKEEIEEQDYSVQAYHQARTEASENAARLLDYINIHKNELSPKEESELLLTVFVAMNAGFRDYEQSIRAVEMLEMLLPMLPDSRIKLYLQVYLYQETGDDSMMEEIYKQMEMIEAKENTIIEENRCLMELYRQMSEQYFV